MKAPMEMLLLSLAPEENRELVRNQVVRLPDTCELGNLTRNQVRRPEVTDGKHGARFHATKVGVDASHGLVVAKGPDGRIKLLTSTLV